MSRYDEEGPALRPIKRLSFSSQTSPGDVDVVITRIMVPSSSVASLMR